MASTNSAPSGSSKILPFVVRIIKPGRKAGALCCPACRSPLNLIQPEEDEPERLLGTCDSCGRWSFLVELETDWKKALLVELPNGDEICRRHAEMELGPGDRSDG